MADAQIDELDQKWSDRFNRLEALLLARTLDKPDPEPTFQLVKVTPTHIPPVNFVKASELFMKPTDLIRLPTDQHPKDPQICLVPHRQVPGKLYRYEHQDWPTHSDLSGTDHHAPQITEHLLHGH